MLLGLRIGPPNMNTQIFLVNEIGRFLCFFLQVFRKLRFKTFSQKLKLLTLCIVRSQGLQFWPLKVTAHAFLVSEI